MNASLASGTSRSLQNDGANSNDDRLIDSGTSATDNIVNDVDDYAYYDVDDDSDDDDMDNDEVDIRDNSDDDIDDDDDDGKEEEEVAEDNGLR